MAESVPIDTREITITPVFHWETLEDVNASERAGHLVKKMRQVVQVRFAGSKLYSPVFPVDAFWKYHDGKMMTYAERWADQFRAFLEGNDQKAAGTPLELLKNYGISEGNLSMCRALKIYSIEALHHLEGSELKSLGMAGNALKDMARAYMADRADGTANADRIAALEAQIAALTLAKPGSEPNTVDVVVPDPKPAEIEATLAQSDAEFAVMDDTALKAFIKSKLGRAPTGTPSHEWLVAAAKEAQELAA